MSDPLLEQIVMVAGHRLLADLQRDLPASAPGIARHLRRVPDLRNPVRGLVLQAFPVLALPYWMTPSTARISSREFLTDVSYSSLSGYYAIRLIDNVTDGDGPKQLPALLPTVGYFEWRFIQPYFGYFPHGHEFWLEFHRLWSEQADRTAQDAMATSITEDIFAQASARKFGASKVPVAAVAYHDGLRDRVEAWYDFVDALGSFVQFLNDFLDWRHDADHGIHTLVQSESIRRRLPDESHQDWFLREGCAWAATRVRSEMRRVAARGRLLENHDVTAWVERRAELLDRQLATVAANPAQSGQGISWLGDRESAH